MKKSKWLALLMAATMVMGVMTGCGGGDTNAPATGDTGTAATTEKKDEKKDDKKDSTLLTKEEYKKRSAWKRFVGWFANMFTPFL